MKVATEPRNDPWPRLRESQRRLARELPFSCSAVTIDIGEGNDIHPLDKRTVGRRLARWAFAAVYGLIGLRDGPGIAFAESAGNGEVKLTFTQVGQGLHAMGDPTLGGFAIAGADGIFFAAAASIEGNDHVLVKSAEVLQPVHVRYAWQNNPVDANMVNKERLPASPFEIRLD